MLKSYDFISNINQTTQVTNSSKTCIEISKNYLPQYVLVNILEIELFDHLAHILKFKLTIENPC